jgi:hypothetical protein
MGRPEGLDGNTDYSFQWEGQWSKFLACCVIEILILKNIRSRFPVVISDPDCSFVSEPENIDLHPTMTPETYEWKRFNILSIQSLEIEGNLS